MLSKERHQTATRPSLTPQEVKTLWEIVLDGGMSFEDYYTHRQKGGLASQERTATDEIRLIDQREFPDDD